MHIYISTICDLLDYQLCNSEMTILWSQQLASWCTCTHACIPVWLWAVARKTTSNASYKREHCMVRNLHHGLQDSDACVQHCSTLVAWYCVYICMHVFQCLCRMFTVATGSMYIYISTAVFSLQANKWLFFIAAHHNNNDNRLNERCGFFFSSSKHVTLLFAQTIYIYKTCPAVKLKIG